MDFYDKHAGVDSGAYRPGSSVRIRLPGDPRAGQIARVDRTYNDSGDMVHVVRFPDGTRAEYDYHDIAALNAL